MQRKIKCVSIEHLKDEWMQKIREKCTLELHYVSRENIDFSADLLSEAEILICRDRDLSEEFLDTFKRLKFIFIVSAGVEKLPFEYLKKRNIRVANSGGISDEAMSDYAVGAMLLFSSRFKECMEYKSQHYWKPYLMTDVLKQKRLLIVGAGKIGQAIAKKASVFGMHITGIKRKLNTLPDFDEISILKDLDIELPKADYVVCTIPLTEETYHLFDRQRFEKMKKTAVFINLSRGKVIDQSALIEILDMRKIRGAVLDVFETEPLEHESALWDLDNVVLTPHSSGRIEDFLRYAVDVFITNVNQYCYGEKMDNAVDLENRY